MSNANDTCPETKASLPVRLRALAVFREVLEDEAVSGAVTLMEALEVGDHRDASGHFSRLWSVLAAGRGEGPESLKNRVEAAIVAAESTFAKLAEAGKTTAEVREQAALEIAILQELSGLSADSIVDEISALEPALGGAWVSRWPGGYFPGGGEVFGSDAGTAVERLEARFRRFGAGIFGRYRAFRWDGERLRPIPSPDGVLPKDLVGYERERGLLLANTGRFMRGLPAQHALLYGAPGTGKSSTVKAVFNHHARDGLKLVEVAKEQLSELPRLLDVLRGRGLRFIVYVDDLSFEEDEVEYKSLKAIIEGSIEQPPENVRVYATSNRRNLIRETFSERDGDDVHARDTVGEKLSLAARFGLRITFLTPDQKTYLSIVRGIVRERNLKLDEGGISALEEVALRRERWSSERSGRAARQAVDDFEAGLSETGK